MNKFDDADDKLPGRIERLIGNVDVTDLENTGTRLITIERPDVISFIEYDDEVGLWFVVARPPFDDYVNNIPVDKSDAKEFVRSVINTNGPWKTYPLSAECSDDSLVAIYDKIKKDFGDGLEFELDED